MKAPQLFPFERAVLNAVAAVLSKEDQTLFAEQVACINKVQRLLEWNEIEFYCMRWFKVRWPAEVLFQERGEIELASGLLQASDVSAVVRVWAVGGHVFCIESDKSLKAFRTATNASFVPTVRPNPSLQPTRASCAGLVG